MTTAALAVLERVSVHGDVFEVARGESTVWVAVGRVCKVLGLEVSGQRQRLSNPDRSPWAIAGVIPACDANGRRHNIFAVSLDSLPLWLATVDTSRVSPSARPKLVLFQREAAKVLREHFFPASPILDGKTISRTEALRLALEASEDRDRLEAEVLTLAPKAEIADRLTDATGALSVEEAAKSLGTGRGRLFDFLRSSGFLLASKLPRQTHIDAKRVIVRERVFEQGGRTRTYARIFLTPKGLTYVAAAFAASEGGQGSRVAEGEGVAS